MIVSARDVAAALRARIPDIPQKKLHKLLYYCQGHHVATFDEPLFRETISAWDMGPVVGELWYEEKNGGATEPSELNELDEAQLNTVGYVVSRYGKLTGKDLGNLTHSEAPWLMADAVRRGTSARIRIEWIRDYFRTDGSPAAGDDEVPFDADGVAEWLAGAHDRRRQPVSHDSRDQLLARRDQIVARLRSA
jgi:uncharacterized phage-associated protein